MKYFAGIDIGTTKSAVVAVDENNKLVWNVSHNHGAALKDGVQNGEKHIATVKMLLKSMPDELKKQVAGVGVTGQMHGIVAWSENGCSPLYSWQSKAANFEAYQRIVPDLKPGFGIGALAQMAENHELEKYCHAGTIHDYLVFLMTHQALTDYTDAASFGAFCLAKMSYKNDLLKKLNIPSGILNEVKAPGSQAGVLGENWEFNPGIPVICACGDNQASVLSTSENPNDEIYLTLGTGAQISTVIDTLQAGVETRPYFNGKFLAVASSLCGGAAWAYLVEYCKDFFRSFNLPLMSDDEFYAMIDKMALRELESSDLPEVYPNFAGERYDINLKGKISGIDLKNYTIGKVAAAWASGIIRNLRDMMKLEILAGRRRILVSGNAIRRNRSLQRACEKVFGLEVVLLASKEEAACGAAKLAKIYWKNRSSK